MQRLILPIDDLKPTAGYKNAKYRSEWGYNHYGIDLVSSAKKRELRAIGDGVVALAGLDGLNGKTTGAGSGCGYCLVIIYKDCENNKTHKAADLTVTYMHLEAMPKVKAGQTVHKGDLLGNYGNTGAATTGAHLHVQMDTDTKYPAYCSGLSAAGHALLKKGTVDSTVNPVEYLFRGTNQKITVPASAWYNSADFVGISAVKPVEYAVGTGTKLVAVYKTKAEAEKFLKELKVYEV